MEEFIFFGMGFAFRLYKDYPKGRLSIAITGNPHPINNTIWCR